MQRDREVEERLRWLERQIECHAVHRRERMNIEEAIGTFQYLLRQTAAIDTALGRDPYQRWLHAKGRVPADRGSGR